ncbi:hypothetical protein [Pontimicrobium aquaticum]|uniref:DUF5678 domain-containing protein n=1 Tax=Pontimicrobium aquaticum TaxID=2565367 RepID=A0A4U0F4J4_9FLAO|nr:hypothetical protein [Pontimicrobium aquaticum]TJY37712.1 hypothetical protein E5167_00205 [Pontimicrobium aquaticum]
MTTYKERKENQYNYVLVKDDIVIATFGNLRKITEFIKDENFPSYWTLVRKKEYPILASEWKIFKVKHY